MPLCCFHLHHLVPGAVVSQLPEAVDEALAGLAVDPACLQHGLALFHQLDDTNKQHRGQISPQTRNARGAKRPLIISMYNN